MEGEREQVATRQALSPFHHVHAQLFERLAEGLEVLGRRHAHLEWHPCLQLWERLRQVHLEEHEPSNAQDRTQDRADAVSKHAWDTLPACTGTCSGQERPRSF